MLSIARLAMKGPFAAAISATVYALLALAFAPFLLVSGGIVCLSGLRHGANAGMRVALSVVVACGGLVFFITKGSTIVLVLFIALVPLVGLASVLRLTENQAVSVTLAAFLAFVYALVVRFTVADINAFWLERLGQFRDAVQAKGGQFLASDELRLVAEMMHASTIVLVMMFLSGALILGRWWQAALYNPGGFGQEFRTFLLPKPLMIVAAAISVMALIALNSAGTLSILADALLLITFLFAMQGLAIVHDRATKKGLAKGFFVFLYIFLVILPHIVGTMLAFIGIIDNIVDFRKLRAVEHR